MKPRRKLHIVFVVAITGILSVIAFIIFNHQKNRTIYDDTVVVEGTYAFSEEGITFYADNRLRYADAKSGKDIILCDKPNCLHEPWSSSNPNPTCNAVVDKMGGSAIATYHDKLYYVFDEDIFNKIVYKADVNGANRKTIARLNDVQASMASCYANQYLIYSYMNLFDQESEEIASEHLEKPVAGVAIIDLDTDTVKKVPEKAGYSASIGSLHYDDGKVYYPYSYFDTYIDFAAIDMNQPETQQYLTQHAYVDLYCYDIRSETETCVYKEQDISVQDYHQHYAYIKKPNNRSGQLYELDLLNGNKTLLFEEEGFRSAYSDGDFIIYMVVQDEPFRYEYNYYNIKTKESNIIGGTDSVAQLFINAILADKIYVSISGKGPEDFSYGYIKKEDFYRGNFDKAVPLIYPNNY